VVLERTDRLHQSEQPDDHRWLVDVDAGVKRKASRRRPGDGGEESFVRVPAGFEQARSADQKDEQNQPEPQEAIGRWVADGKELAVQDQWTGLRRAAVAECDYLGQTPERRHEALVAACG
jgi:hypothetical protein